MKSTERHTADTQITGLVDCKIEATAEVITSRLSPRFYIIQVCLLFVSYQSYGVNSYAVWWTRPKIATVISDFFIYPKYKSWTSSVFSIIFADQYKKIIIFECSCSFFTEWLIYLEAYLQRENEKILSLGRCWKKIGVT